MVEFCCRNKNPSCAAGQLDVIWNLCGATDAWQGVLFLLVSGELEIMGALTLASSYTRGQSTQKLVFLPFLPGSDTIIVHVFHWVKTDCMVFPECQVDGT